MSESPVDPYDEVPYESRSFPLSHPDNLATVAALFGMSPAAPDRARVLELGCGRGENLLPMAASLPGARLHGIDLSRRQVDEAQAWVATAGLENLTIEHRDIVDFPSDAGVFDYIVCHGVYSWVADPVRERILEICAHHLAAQGVAYVSYNTYPGWHMRAMMREMMCYHAARFENTAERIEQARALLDFLAEAVPVHSGPYGLLLAEELELVRSREDSYLAHEHLEHHNVPVYFHRFAEAAQRHGLRYLGEARFADMLCAGEFPPEIEETLARIAPDIVHMEQYLDFLRNRMFRRTLLCRQAVELDRGIEPGRAHDLFVAGCLEFDPVADGGDEGQPAAERFTHPELGTITVQDSRERKALLLLGTAWPRSVAVRELAERASGGENLDEALTLISQLVLKAYSAGMLDLRPGPDRFRCEAGTSPSATPLARHQAAVGMTVTNLRQEQVELDRLARFLLQHLDGATDRDALCSVLRTEMDVGGIALTLDGARLGESPELDMILPDVVSHGLDVLGAAGLLLD